MFKGFYFFLPLLLLSICTHEVSSAHRSVDLPINMDMQSQEMVEVIPFAGKVIGNRVRLRLQPNLEAYIVRELERGEVFAVFGEKDGYYALQPTKEMKAYVCKTFVSEYTLEGDRVNVRLAPNLESPIIVQLNKGDKVTGQISEEHNKWLEIDIPKEVYFWVAKDYVHEIGDLAFAENYQKQRTDLQQLIKTTTLMTQAELQKPIYEIDFERSLLNFEKIAKKYPEFEEEIVVIKELVNNFQHTFAEKKIAYLENQACLAKKEVTELQSNIPLTTDSLVDNNSIHTEKKMKYTDNPLLKMPINLFQSPPTLTYSALSKYMTDKMKVWESVEETLHQQWLSTNPSATVEDFYGEELLDSIVISGLLEPFNYSVKNKPGEYLLRKNNTPIAYLYSTHVNLQEKVGEKLSFRVVQRANNQFAFPAYQVISIE